MITIMCGFLPKHLADLLGECQVHTDVIAT